MPASRKLWCFHHREILWFWSSENWVWESVLWSVSVVRRGQKLWSVLRAIGWCSGRIQHKIPISTFQQTMLPPLASMLRSQTWHTLLWDPSPTHHSWVWASLCLLFGLYHMPGSSPLNIISSCHPWPQLLTGFWKPSYFDTILIINLTLIWIMLLSKESPASQARLCAWWEWGFVLVLLSLRVGRGEADSGQMVCIGLGAVLGRCSS